MPIPAFSKAVLVAATPAAAGEIAIDANGHIQVYNAVSSSVDVYAPGAPAGSVEMWAGAANAPPAGYLTCDGSSVLRSAYPALFTAIGTIYGTADGSHFNLPLTNTRVVVGVDSSTPFCAAVGYNGGQVSNSSPVHQHYMGDHAHTEGSHNHTEGSHTHTGPSHSHGLVAGYAMVAAGSTAAPNFWINTYVGATSWGPSVNAGWPSAPSGGGSTRTTGAKLGGTTDGAGTGATGASNGAGTGYAAGGGTGNAGSAVLTSYEQTDVVVNVLQPYIVMSYIIKT